MDDKRIKLLIPVSCGLTLFLGIESGGFQLILVQVASEFSLGPVMMGVLVAAQYTAITLAPLLFGWIADRAGKKPILLIFMLLFAGACFLTAASPSAVVFIGSIFLVGAGYSVCECIGTSALSDAFPGRENRYLNIMQSTFSTGAVISPLLFRRLLSTGTFTWRSVFVLSGCGYLLLFPLMLAARCRSPASKNTAEPGDGEGPAMTWRTLFRSFFIIVLLFSMLAYVAIETGAAFFANSLFITEYNNTRFGAYAISLYWLGMSVARFVFAYLKIKGRTMVLLGFAASFLILIMMLLFKNEWLLVAMFAALGTMMGPVWPMIVGMGTSSYRKLSGTIASILTAAGGLGGAIVPILIGAVTDRTGLYGGFFLLALLSLAGFLVMLIGSAPRRLFNV
jgi:FHS family glucose/mannose:H+ symporter-like MFS transporter